MGYFRWAREETINKVGTWGTISIGIVGIFWRPALVALPCYFVTMFPFFLYLAKIAEDIRRRNLDRVVGQWVVLHCVIVALILYLNSVLPWMRSLPYTLGTALFFSVGETVVMWGVLQAHRKSYHR